MEYLDFLRAVHERLAPPTYLEIGVRHGHSLALSRARTIGVDPDYELREPAQVEPALFEQTSDDFFARPDPLEHFGGDPPALAFIDGMHLAEYALRDFINVERHSGWATVAAIDDIFPRDADEGARGRLTRAWAGDVFKLPGVLEERRPDLTALRVDVEPTGLLLVLGLDSGSRALSDHYDEIAAGIETPDPQTVPEDVLAREGVLDPEAVLGASFWDVLRLAPGGELDARRGRAKLRRALRRDFGRLSRVRALLSSRG